MFEVFKNALDLLKPQALDHVVEGRHYVVEPESDGLKLGSLIVPPAKPTLQLATLSGFVDAYNSSIDEFKDAAIHVIDHSTVALISLKADDQGRRHEWLRTTNREVNPFPFGKYQDPESFIINLQSGFLPEEDIITLQRLASSLSTENSIGTQDDGISQTVTVKQGSVTKVMVELPRRIKLRAYRTFREVDPVASEFLVRMQGDPGKLPTVALIEIDANKWKHDTVLMISNWLRKRLEKAIIIA